MLMVSVFDGYMLVIFGIVVRMCLWKLITHVNYLRLDLIHLCQTVYVDYD